MCESQLPDWVKDNEFWLVEFDDGDSAVGIPETEYRVEMSIEHANTISSVAVRGSNSDHVMHYPLLDIDIDVRLVPSSTNGHYHLYLGTLMNHDQYSKLLDVLEEVGIIQHGFARQLDERGATFLRLPGVKKEVKP